MTKAFAIMTDIHGNFTALEAVLEDIRRMSAQSNIENYELLCLGDSFDGGPEPLRVFDTLQKMGCVHLRGNHEDYLFDCLRHPESEVYQRPLWKFVPWTVARMGETLLDVEKMCLERWSDVAGGLHAVHADVKSNKRVPDFFANQSGLSPTFVENLELEQLSAVYVNGHSHYLGNHRNPLTNEVWINCGSVGYPFVDKPLSSGNAPVATWVWLEIESAQLPHQKVRVFNRRVPYSADALLQHYVESGALEACLPFSFAIAAQSLFNQDVVYPFFQQVKGLNLTPRETAHLLLRELERQSVPERINALLQRLGYHPLSLRI